MIWPALRDFLAEMFLEPRTQHRIVSDAGMDLRRIAFLPQAIDAWHSILEEAERQGRLDDLIAIAQTELPAHRARLQHLLDESRARIRFDLAPGLAQLAAASRALLSWRQTLPNGDWIERPELGRLYDRIMGGEESRIALLGVPGSGKSALLARLGQRLAAENTALLAIKAELLRRNVETLPDLERSLDLPVGVDRYLADVTRERRIVLLIDQLDALGDLVDLHTARLDVLLQLLDRVADVKNLHLIVSCRTFEFHHDTRLRRLDLQEVTLSLPSWPDVDALLKARNIDSSTWPTKFREMLCTPQHLAVFLGNLHTLSGSVFPSYQAMLEEVWKQRVLDRTGSPGRAALLQDAARIMSEEEQFWLPAARFDDRPLELEQLEAAGILCRGADRMTVGFVHQSVFEFTLARTFAAAGALSRHVLERQDAVFVRPKLWSALFYLRATTTAVYVREFEVLWSYVTLRPHLRLLLIDFLGQVADPTDQEAAWLFPYLYDPAYHARVLQAVAGNRAWFERMVKTHLPTLMSSAAEIAGRTTAVLSAAVGFARDEVLQLIEHYWLPRPEMHRAAWFTLMMLPTWDQRAVDTVLAILAQSAFNTRDVLHMATIVSEAALMLAPRIVGAVFRKGAAHARSRPEENTGLVQPAFSTRWTWRDLHPFRKRLDETRRSAPQRRPRPETNHEQELIAWRLDDKHHAPFEKLLGGGDWFGLNKIATAAPDAFLEEMWQPFLDTISVLAAEANRIIVSYRSIWSTATALDGDIVYVDSVTRAMGAALVALASYAPAALLSFVQRWQTNDLLLVHRLLARGLAALPQSGVEGVRYASWLTSVTSGFA